MFMKEKGAEFSGGGQGNAPKPVTKRQGSQHLARIEKEKYVPKPQPATVRGR
jgi:hypothetical protein